MSDSIVIAPEVDIDSSRADASRMQRMDAARYSRGPRNRLVVDLSQVEAVDSGALGVLVELDNRLERPSACCRCRGRIGRRGDPERERPAPPIANLRQPAGSR